MKNQNSWANEVIERIKQAEGLRFDADVARAFSVDRRLVTNWKASGRIPLEYLRECAEEHGYSLEWLVNGRGPRDLVDLNRIAEPAARYGGGISFELHHQVAETVRELLDEEGAHDRMDNAKVDHLIAYCYDVTVKNDSKIDREQIRAIIKLAI